jgi:anti-sigma factor RsiW
VRCQETQALLDGYVDRELDVVRSVEVEHHLQDCQACAHVYKYHQALRSALKGGDLYFRPPAHLYKRVRAAARKAHHAETRSRVWPWRGLSAAASLAAVVLLVWSLVPMLTGPSANDRLTRELIAGHVRSLMASHLTDVASSDQHTVKPWFEGKLDFSPPVIDLTEQGFPLVGARLDYLDNRPVAALVYQRQHHVINLFLWPSAHDAEKGEQMITRQGYHLMHWAQSGLSYWAVSNLNLGELQAFVQRVQQAMQNTPGTSTSFWRDPRGASRSGAAREYAREPWGWRSPAG